MAAHGVPRGTQDLDLWVEPTRANAELVWRALADFGEPLQSLQLNLDDLTSADTVVQLGLPPGRIGLLTSLTGLPSFAQAWERRVTAKVMGVELPILGRAELVANKQAVGRPKDLADLHALGE